MPGPLLQNISHNFPPLPTISYFQDGSTRFGTAQILDTPLSDIPNPPSKVQGPASLSIPSFSAISQPSWPKWLRFFPPQWVTASNAAIGYSCGHFSLRADSLKFNKPLSASNDLFVPRSRSFAGRILCWHHRVGLCPRPIRYEFLLGMALGQDR